MTGRLIALFCFLRAAVALDPVVIENDAVRVTVDPRQGAVTSLVYKNAISFPYIAGKGAGVAATGSLFAPVIRSGDRKLEAPLAVRSRTARSVTLTGTTSGIQFTRTISLEERSAAVAITDTLRNSGSASVKARLGSASEKKRESWLLADRSWSGPPAQQSAQPDRTNRGESRAEFGWRVIGQYGAGFLYRVSPPGADAARFEQSGQRFEWESAALTLAPGASASARSEVFVHEGSSGRSETAAGPLLVDADLAEAGAPGEPLRGFARVVASVPERVKVVVSQLGPSARAVASSVMELQPGKEGSLPFRITPEAKGPLQVEVAAFDGAGRKIAAARAQALIGVPGAAWDLYNRRMPEEIYHGTWEQIGEQMAKASQRIGAPTSVEISKQKAANKSLFAFYERRFPYYAGILRGAAKQLGADPADIASLGPREPAQEACMNIAFHGPDGPINAFSKERSNTNLKGLGYQKVIPSTGYPFHIYMSYGVNSEGLSTSGATLNEDAATLRAGMRLADERRNAGQPLMPRSLAMWMILSMCRNVDEALALIDSKDAPFEFTGNMMLLDRAGNAARVESAGIMHQIFRPKVGEKGFFVAGNYPHKREDGLFDIGERWGWAANTMLRERALWNAAGGRHDRISLDDVFTLMQTHGPGGMCQHIHDNPGLLYSSCSYVAVTRTSDLWLADGPPCQVRYFRYGLQD